MNSQLHTRAGLPLSSSENALIALRLATLGMLFFAAKPNLFFLSAVDRYNEAERALGHTDIDTPNPGRLTAQGMTFTPTCHMGSWSAGV